MDPGPVFRECMTFFTFIELEFLVAAEVELIGVPMIRGDAWCISSKGANLDCVPPPLD